MGVKTETNPKGAGAKTKGNKPKVAFQNRIDANLVEMWEQKIPKGKRVEHLEKALRQYLEPLLLPD
jgi:elongation factor P hydroxylase